MTPRPAPPAAPDPSPAAFAVRGVVRATVDIAAPPERVFRALTDPAELAAWWAPHDGGEGGGGEGGAGRAPEERSQKPSQEWRVDVRPGGRWSLRTRDAAGRPAAVRGEYRVVDPPRALECSWRASWDDDAETTVRYELAPAEVGGAPGTRLTVTHTGPAVTLCAATHSAATLSAALRAALVRLLAPARPAWLAGGAAPAWARRPGRRARA
jgi:uncharacterized protein YndB with AHSA1/START domain